jgi:acetoin utilization deacetylase AcuC-like enzyme
MKIVFNDRFYNSDYINDGASAPGRMEAIMGSVINESGYEVIQCDGAELQDIARVHESNYIESVKKDSTLYDMAILSAGGAIRASRIAMETEPAFACIRPPGHHAHPSSAWGYCVFCNMAVALKKLRHEGMINSAFILDFDAHGGDGTIDCLSDWKEAIILNPMADDRNSYIALVEGFVKHLDYVDIIAVNAGFDSYEKDAGHKLATFDFYRIGYILKLLAKKMGHERRFAILEGGYYLPDLGKNVLAFCQGFE